MIHENTGILNPDLFRKILCGCGRVRYVTQSNLTAMGRVKCPCGGTFRVESDMACINCSEEHDGGYYCENGPGPFCSACWQKLADHFSESHSPATGGAPLDYKALYYELLYEVVHKVPNESRHESAQRIIRQHETPSGDQCSAKEASPRQPAGEQP